MEKSLFQKTWPLLSIVILVIWSVLFWHVFIVEWSHKKMHVPIGMGGAIYFMFFLPPVFIGSAIYQLIVYKIMKEMAVQKWFLISILLPLTAISILLLVFCPIESELSYLAYLYKSLTN